MTARLAAAFVAAALALVGCRGEAGPTVAPEPATSSTMAPPQMADVHAVIRRGLSSLASFRADVIVTRSGLHSETRATVEWTAQGLVKETESFPSSERVFFYDGREGRRVVYYAPTDARGGSPTARVEHGIPVGRPNPPPNYFDARPDPVGLARQVLDWDDARISRENVDGRAAWVVQHSAPGTRPELHVVTVDDLTGLALRVDALHAGQPEFQVRVQNLATGLAVEPSLAVPDGVPVSSVDHGFRRMRLEEAGRAAGYVPVLPAWLPSGFSQAEVTFGPRLEAGRRSVISVAFRRGMDLVVLTTGLREAAAENPFAPPFSAPRPPPGDEGALPEPVRFEPVTLAGGAFAGAMAERWLQLGKSYLFVANDSLLVTAVGDLTPEEMLRLAGSLQRSA